MHGCQRKAPIGTDGRGTRDGVPGLGVERTGGIESNA